ncbi:MAG: AAA family ATPase [Chloroflexota bacterium]
MIDTLLQTKLYLPSNPQETVERHQLFARLEAGINRKLTLITAPAGYGKTTLIASWLHTSEHADQTLWYALDAEDSDPQRFFRYLAAGLAGLTDAQLMLPRVVSTDQRLPSKSVATVLINDVLTISTRFFVVLDDFHLIQNRHIGDALTYLLEHMPPNMHLIITSRTEPKLPIAKLRARREINEMDAVDLRMTPSESDALLQQFGLVLPSDLTKTLKVKTEGWAAGLQLAAIALQSQKISQNRAQFIHLFAGSSRFIFDYLSDEVLNDQPAATKEFLLKTSILERLNADLCQTLLPATDPGEMLRNLEQNKSTAGGPIKRPPG